MVKIRKILVLVDFSQNSEGAAHYAMDIAREKHASVYFLHMINQRIIEAVQQLSSKGYKGDFLQALRKLIEDRENDLKQFIPEDLRQGLDMEFLIRKGEPAEEVVNIAREFSIDLIVVGSHGHTTPSAGSLGSVAQHVVNYAHCPVLVVRPIEHDFIEHPSTEA